MADLGHNHELWLAGLSLSVLVPGASLLGLAWQIIIRRRTEKALNDSQEFLRVAVEAAELRVWTLDREDLSSGKQCKNICTLLGERRQCEGQCWNNCPAVRAILPLVSPESPLFHLEDLPIPRSNPARWASVRGRAFFSRDGQVERLTGVMAEVTKSLEEKQRNRELYSSLQATLDAIPDLVFEFDRESSICRYHCHNSDDLYVPPERILGKKVEQILPPAAAQVVSAALAETLQKGLHFGGIYSLDFPSGRKWFELSMAVKGEVKNGKAHIVAIARNITHRKETEDRLVEANTRFQLLLDSVPVGVAIAEDPDCRVVLPNRMAAKLMNLDPGANASASAENPPPIKYWTNGREMAADELPLQIAIRSNSPVPPTELEVELPGGHRFSSLISAVPFHNVDGSLAGAIGVIFDITDIKQAKSLLAASEMRFRTLAQATSEAIIISENGFIEDANDQLLQLLGYSASELIGNHIGGLVCPSQREDVLQNIYQNIESSSEAELIHKNGSKVLVQARGCPFQFNGRKLRLSSFRDITAQRQVEVELQRQQERVLHAERVALAGHFSASVAHELQRPLAAIQRNAEAAEIFLKSESPDIGEVCSTVVDIQIANRRAVEILNRLRRMFRKESVSFREVCLGDIIRESLLIVRSMAQANKIRTIYSRSDVLPVVFGDPVQLQQVITNLLANAIEASASIPEGQRTVRISCSADEVWVRVVVHDSGPGFSQEAMGRIFEPFFTTKTEGLGMGLLICREIINSHQGRIWAENQNPGASLICEVPAKL